MKYDYRFSLEFDLINKILFNEDFNSEEKLIFKKVNYETFVEISSNELILPAIYSNLKIKNHLNLIPGELEKYLSEIFEINFNRNKKIINEAKEISKLLSYNKINYVFFKGVANLFYQIYNNIGERMIGDIDFLFDFKQKEKLESILKSENYKTKLKFQFYESRHLPRSYKENNLSAIEPHTKLFDCNGLINHSNIMLKNKITVKGINIPEKNCLLRNNIYNSEINDKSSLFLRYNYRSIYDTFMIIKNQKIPINNLKKTKHIENYFCRANKIQDNLFDYTKQNLFSFIKIRILFRKKIPLYYYFEFFFILALDEVKKYKIRPRQFFGLITDKQYRKHLKVKILRKINFHKDSKY